MNRNFKIKFLRSVDFLVGKIIIFLLTPFKIFKGRLQEEPKKILAIRLWGLGSAVLNVPAINAVKKCYPDSALFILEGSGIKGVFKQYRFIDEIYTTKVTAPGMAKFIFRHFMDFDLAIDFEEYFLSTVIIAFLTGKRSAGFDKLKTLKLFDIKVEFNDRQYVAETYIDILRNLGCKPGKGRLIYPEFSKGESERINSRMKGLGLDSDKNMPVGFCTGAAESARERMWPLENFALLADYLIEKYNVKIVLIGSKGEYKLNEELLLKSRFPENVLNLAGKLSVEELFFSMRRFSLFVSNDTGPMHMAGAAGIPVVALFGPNLPLRYAPRGENTVVCYRGISCSPCIHAHKGIIPDCKKENRGECMKMISVDSVKCAVDKLLPKQDSG